VGLRGNQDKRKSNSEEVNQASGKLSLYIQKSGSLRRSNQVGRQKPASCSTKRTKSAVHGRKSVKPAQSDVEQCLRTVGKTDEIKKSPPIKTSISHKVLDKTPEKRKTATIGITQRPNRTQRKRLSEEDKGPTWDQISHQSSSTQRDQTNKHNGEKKGLFGGERPV